MNKLLLYHNQISDITPLSNLTKLTWIDLNDNQISDISPLSNLTMMSHLILDSNQIKNISPLSKLTNLLFINLNNNPINNASTPGAIHKHELDFTVADKLYEVWVVEGDIEEGGNTTPSLITFKDLKGHWSESLVMELYKKGIISGYEDNSIRPDNEISRAEAAVIIAHALNLEPLIDSQTDFKDDDKIPEWAKGYIKAVNQRSIMKGYPDNTFKPSDKLTRQELVVMVINAFEFKEDTKELTFLDKDLIGDWAKESIEIAVNIEMLSGYPDNTFRPRNTITRAETFAVLAKALKAK